MVWPFLNAVRSRQPALPLAFRASWVFAPGFGAAWHATCSPARTVTEQRRIDQNGIDRMGPARRQWKLQAAMKKAARTLMIIERKLPEHGPGHAAGTGLRFSVPVFDMAQVACR